MKKLPLLLNIITIGLFIAMLSTAGFAKSLQHQLMTESTVEQVKRKGVLRVGMDTFKPWAMKSKTGEYVGFEIDVAKQLAEDMGVKVEFVPTKWDGIVPALLTGKFDVIIGGMGITTKRSFKVNFTQPYEFSGMSLVAHKEKAAGFTDLAQFNSPDVEIAVKLGTTAGDAAKKYFPKAKLRPFQDEAQTFQELRNGKVHAVVSSAPRPAYEALKYSETLFLPSDETFTKEPIGFAIRKGDVDSLAFFNGWITNNWLNGFLKERHNYWFNTKEWNDLVE